MNSASNIQATIGENVSGQIAIGSHILQVGDVNGSIVNISIPGDLPACSRRPLPVDWRPLPFPSLLDREEEFESVKSAFQASVPISIYGEEGIGKTSFLRQLTHLSIVNEFADGVVYLDASGLGLDDLLQCLFEAFHESQLSFKPTRIEILNALRGLKALIVLDDLDIQRDRVFSLLNAAPDCIFVLSAVEQSLLGEGQQVLLHGLPEKDALALFERDLARSLNEEERVATKKIVTLLHGHPARILQASKFFRERSRPILEALDEWQGEASESKMVESSLNVLTEPEEKILAILAASGGTIVPLEHLVSLSNNKDAQKALQGLIALGMVQTHSPRYSLTGGLTAILANLLDLSLWEDTLITYFVNWLAQKPTQALVEESADVLITMFKMAEAKKRWSDVIQIGRSLEHMLIVGKRWQAWSDILTSILKAAKAIGDRRTEAWALHQLGSRALCLGLMDEAKQLLTQALNIRQAIRDRAGLAVTQHNLNVLFGGLPPTGGGTSGCRRCFNYGCGATGILVVMTIITFIVARSLFSSGSRHQASPLQIPTASPFELPATWTPDLKATATLQATSTFVPQASPLPTYTSTMTFLPTEIPTFTETSTLSPTPSFTSSPLPTYTSTMALIPTETSTIIPTTSQSTPSVPVVSPMGDVDCSTDYIVPVYLKWNQPDTSTTVVQYEVSLYYSNDNRFSWTPLSDQYVREMDYDISEFVSKYCGYWFAWSVHAFNSDNTPGKWSDWSYFDTIKILFDFVANAPKASWSSSAGKFDFNIRFGDQPQKVGGALYGDKDLEDYSYRKNILVVYPYPKNYGEIDGTYYVPEIIRPGDRFVSKVGYVIGCDAARFWLYYWNGDPNQPRELLAYKEDAYDGRLLDWNFNLPTKVENQIGWFILEVTTEKYSCDNSLVWLVARLERP